MGVIKRQGFKRSIISYLSVLIGIASTLFVYPLELSMYGAAQFYISLAVLIAPIASFGFQTLAIRFFPEFKHPDAQDHGFLGFLSLGSVLSFVLFTGLVFLSRHWWLQLFQFLGFKGDIITENLLLIGVLTFCHVFMNLYTNYAGNLNRIVIPELFRNLSLKIALPLLVLAFHFQWIGNTGFELGLSLVFLLISLALALYLKYLGTWNLRIDWSILTSDRRRRMFDYAFFGMLTVVGSALAFRLDNIMITSILDTEKNGIYNIALFITNTILIPYHAIVAIASPIIADRWARNEQDDILDIYRRSSLNLLLIGLFLLGTIYLVLDNLLQLSSNYAALAAIDEVVLLLGIAKLIDMTTGVNTQIIAHSSFYRFNLYIILLLGLLNFGLNYWLIPIYGIKGAAWATLISLGLYNTAKFFFIWFQFKMQPFTLSALKVLAVGGVAYGLTTLLPDTSWPIVNLVLLGGSFTLLFWVPTFWWRLSPDINDFLEPMWQRFRDWAKP